MENTQSFTPVRRTRRNADQWHAIMVDHFETDETPQQLAERLGCALSTVEVQMKKATAPDQEPRKTSQGGFVEVKRPVRTPTAQQAVLSLKTATGITVTFAALPPPEYLAAALGLRV